MKEEKRGEKHSLKYWYRYGKEYLTASGIADPDTDSRILLEYAANIDRSYYYLHMDEPVEEETAGIYCRLLEERAGREPVQYLTREAPFYGSLFYVSPHVLIPRQDTEILVEEAGKHLMPGMRLLDLCTGSGCILLSLLKQHDVTGIGADISQAALDVAEENRRRMGVRASWIRSDLFAEIDGKFDMIVSNPPYIASNVLRELDPEVIDHEPVLALDGGEEGLDILKKIVGGVSDHLCSGGWLFLEIGYDQGQAVRELLSDKNFKEIQIIRDLGNRDRVAAGRRP